MRIALTGFACLLLFSSPARSQQSFTDHRPRLLLDAEVGSEVSLGYKLPSVGLGSSLEVPIAKRLEIQESILYSPDRKAITNDGESVKVSGSALWFVTERFGFVGGVDRSWLWTSQFDKGNWSPSAGIVVRNDYFGHGRLYLAYVFPTGCVWATTANPCTIQSNRLQGVEVRQEARSRFHMRWGLKGGFYRFCDQGNPNDSQAGRNCHFAAIGLATLHFESHLGSPSHSGVPSTNREDNY